MGRLFFCEGPMHRDDFDYCDNLNDDRVYRAISMAVVVSRDQRTLWKPWSRQLFRLIWLTTASFATMSVRPLQVVLCHWGPIKVPLASFYGHFDPTMLVNSSCSKTVHSCITLQSRSVRVLCSSIPGANGKNVFFFSYFSRQCVDTFLSVNDRWTNVAVCQTKPQLI